MQRDSPACQVAAENPIQMIMVSYSFIDRNTLPGINYEYWLNVLWSDWSISLEVSTRILADLRKYQPTIWQ